MKTEHILVIRFSAMGDVAMTVPVVYALAKTYPHVRVTVLSRPWARGFFEDLSPNVSFMGADLNHENKGIHGLNVLYRRLAAKNFTAIADLHDVLRSQYLRLRFRLGGFKTAHINKHRRQRHALTRQHEKVLQPLPTAFENYRDVLSRLGYPVTIDFHSVFSGSLPDLTSLKNATLIGRKSSDERWVGIAPFAAHRGKIYPRELMEQVIRRLLSLNANLRIFLFGGGQAETKVLKEMADISPRITFASDLLNGLEEELMVMSHLDAMLSMDSANMHLASLVAIPVVSVWGATHPYAGFMGWHQKADDAVGIDLPCRPCSIFGNKPCLRGDYACMTGIRPEMIVDKLKKYILS